MTDQHIDDNKYAATDPPEDRHIQTWVVKRLHKKVGPSTKNSSTQGLHVHEIKCATQTPNTDQLDQPFVQSMDDYLFQKQQELHSLNSDFLAFLNARENKIKVLSEEMKYLKDIRSDDDRIT